MTWYVVLGVLAVFLLAALLGGGDPRGALYKAGRFLGDANAVARGRIGRRIARRAAGKATGRLFRRWFG